MTSFSGSTIIISHFFPIPLTVHEGQNESMERISVARGLLKVLTIYEKLSNLRCKMSYECCSFGVNPSQAYSTNRPSKIESYEPFLPSSSSRPSRCSYPCRREGNGLIIPRHDLIFLALKLIVNFGACTEVEKCNGIRVIHTDIFFPFTCARCY